MGLETAQVQGEQESRSQDPENPERPKRMTPIQTLWLIAAVAQVPLGAFSAVGFWIISSKIRVSSGSRIPVSFFGYVVIVAWLISLALTITLPLTWEK